MAARKKGSIIRENDNPTIFQLMKINYYQRSKWNSHGNQEFRESISYRQDSTEDSTTYWSCFHQNQPISVLVCVFAHLVLRHHLFTGSCTWLLIMHSSEYLKISIKFELFQLVPQTIFDRSSNQIENIIMFVSYSPYRKSYHHWKLHIPGPRVISVYFNLPDERAFGFHFKTESKFITAAPH